jgi:hypothetical protein
MQQPPHLVSQYSPKLRLDDAMEIRRLHRLGVTPAELARRYGVARSSLRAVLVGHAHVCTLTVRVDDRVFGQLRAAAARRGVTVEACVADAIHQLCGNDPAR